MTESEHGVATTENPTDERQAAHERVATGALANWMRACAAHPWRVVVSWLGIIAVLIVLVATIGGSLRDEFTIPGSDTQKATDLIEASVIVPKPDGNPPTPVFRVLLISNVAPSAT